MNTSRGGPSGLIDTPESRSALDELDTIALWMDRRFLDPILGFFLPGAGNTVSALVGLWGVFVALRLEVHPVVIARMLVNLALDSILGSIPLIGVVFDIFYRAHVRNYDLLRERASHGQARASDWFIVGLAVLLFVFALILPLLVAGLLLFWLFRAFGTMW